MIVEAKSTLLQVRAISNENRLQILEWIMDPVTHFPPQKDGDLIEDGVCVAFITQKIGLRQPTVTAHMKVLEDAGLVSHKQIKNWVFYKPDRKAITNLVDSLAESLQVRNSD